MKKERQQELDQNIVAEGLVKFYKKIEPYSKLILAGIVLVVVAFLGLGLYTSGQTAKRSDATLQLLMNNPEVSSQFPGTVAAAWSLLNQGNQNLSLGVTALYQDRDEAETLLNQARDYFKDARGSSKDKILISRANLGVGLASESLGEIDDAIEAYERCKEANESEQMVEVAQSRIDALSLPANQDFLAWFAAQDFTPADPSLPPELPGASSLPDLPDLDLPDLSLDEGLTEGDDGPKTQAGSTTPEETGIALPDAGPDSSESTEDETDE